MAGLLGTGDGSLVLCTGGVLAFVCRDSFVGGERVGVLWFGESGPRLGDFLQGVVVVVSPGCCGGGFQGPGGVEALKIC